MAYVADLHIHSRFSRACSREINIPNLTKWAKLKGIDLMGTGDFLHPLWFGELKNVLSDRGDGLYEYQGIKFLLTCEISCIYSDKDKVRRIHIVVMMPSFESASKLAAEFSRRKVNIASDGRPITGFSAEQLCDIVLSVDPKAIIIPAHIWTPWFSLFGSESGYDLFKDCFGKFSDSILGIETGLSSEPAMNWRVGDLDQKSILSFSDAHSVPNIGREVTIFGGHLSFDDLRSDLTAQNIIGTIEFFPEEGKYHYSGHRNCDVVYSPQDLKEKGKICPKCDKRLTVGVMQRVEDLATRSLEDLKLKNDNGVIKSEAFPKRPGFRMLVGLEKIIAEALGVTTASQKVRIEYEKLITALGPELKILTKIPAEEIKSWTAAKVAEGVERVRQGKLHIEPGFDNTYGKVNIWGKEDNLDDKIKQKGLFE